MDTAVVLPPAPACAVVQRAPSSAAVAASASAPPAAAAAPVPRPDLRYPRTTLVLLMSLI